MKVSGVILAGGHSRRMGQDKALMVCDNQSLLERVRDRLLDHCDEILVVAPPEKLETYSGIQTVRLVADASDLQGPLVGLRAGLAAASNELIFAVGCDMPALQPAAINLVLQSAPDFDVVVPVINGHREPLHARYRRRCLVAVDQVLEQGVRGIPSFYPEVSVHEIGEPELRQVDPQLVSLTNINTLVQWSDFRNRTGC